MIQQFVQNLSVDLIQEIHLFGVSFIVLIPVVEIDGRVEELLPNFLRFVFDADVHNVASNVRNFDVRTFLIDLPTVVFFLQDLLNPLHRHLHRRLDVTTPLIEILETIVYLVLLADLYAVLHWKTGTILQNLQQTQGLQFAH